MPIYEYQCAECEEQIERFQRLNDPPPEACEVCGGAMRRLVSAPAFQFKGTGWYVTDYAGRKPSDATEDGGSSSVKSEKPSSEKSNGRKAITASASKSSVGEKAD